MKIEFLGVGEALDPHFGNTSTIVESDTSLLIDCGYAVPTCILQNSTDADRFDAVYLSHFHADHVFGLPALILYMHSRSRTKPLTIIGQPESKKRFERIVHMGYPNLLTRLSFPIDYLESESHLEFRDLKLSFARSNHPMPNQSLKIQSGDISLGVSGDGAMSDATRRLFADCRALIHESYTFDEDVAGHCNAKQLFDFASRRDGLEALFLVHVEREHRQELIARVRELAPSLSFDVCVPEAGYILRLD